MSNLHARIAALVPKMDGWCSVEKANDLALAVIKLRGAVSVEIGVWGGRSLLPIAMAHQEQDFGVAWAIDPWTNAASVEHQNEANAGWWGKVDHEMIYQRFLAHLKNEGVEKYVKVVRQKSDDVEPPPAIALLHVDGNHSDQAVKDITRFAPNVITGGFVFVDDIAWEGGGVTRAVEKLLSMGFVKLFDRDTGAMFQRVATKTAVIARPAKAKKKKRSK